MSPVDLTRERWLRLVREAILAAALPHADPGPLGDRATAMREVASPVDGAGRCACNTFRWACLWFVQSDAITRVQLAPHLTAIADSVARFLAPPPETPEAAAAALPVPPTPEEDPSWVQRADCGRG